MESAPAVVVITAYGGDWLRRCVASIRAQQQLPSHIHVVVSHPRPVPLPSDGPDLSIHHAAEAVHFAHAANLGLSYARGSDILLLNDDTALAPDALQALVAARVEAGEGIYQPRILLDTPPGSDQVVDNTGHRLFFDGFNVARERGVARTRSRPPACGRVGGFSGAAVLLTQGMLETVGDFDASFEAFGEDLDLSLRATRCGFEIRFVDNATVIHGLGSSYGRVNPKKVFLVERNRVRAAIRSLPRPLVATLPVWTLCRFALQGAASTRGRGVGADVGPKEAAAALVGNVAGWLSLRDALRKRNVDKETWTLSEYEMFRHILRHHARPRDLVSHLPRDYTP